MIDKIIKEDGPLLATCGAIWSYCSLVNVSNIAQQIGVIFAGLTAILVFLHRIYIFWKDTHK
jgi:hypothetical protein